MPRLIVLNGMPAVGKTTLARRYADDHPMTLVLELDTIRRLLGRWRDDATRAGLRARSMSLAMAGEHLRAGFDVVVPQYLGRPAFLEQTEQLAHDTGARFFEFVLSDDRDRLLARFTERTAAAAEPAHVDAGWLVSEAGGTDAFMTMYDRLLLILSSRPGAQVVPCPAGGADAAYQELLRRIDSPPPPPQRLR
jgi:predicted kinase